MNPIQNKSSSTTFYWTESNCIFHLNALNSFSIGLLKEKRDVLKNSAKFKQKKEINHNKWKENDEKKHTKYKKFIMKYITNYYKVERNCNNNKILNRG